MLPLGGNATPMVAPDESTPLARMHAFDGQVGAAILPQAEGRLPLIAYSPAQHSGRWPRLSRPLVDAEPTVVAVLGYQPPGESSSLV